MTKVPDSTLDAACKTIAHDADKVHAWINNTLAHSLVTKSAYAFKNRTKPWNEIRDKVIAKWTHDDPALQKSDYSPSNVTDASGFRIVSLFNAEIPVVLDTLFDLLKLPLPTDSPGRFQNDCVREVLFYSSRREGDPLSILSEVETVVKRHGHFDCFSVPVGKDKSKHTSSYSSVHVIVRAEVGHTPNRLEATSEIQLRSVFEEAWSEINHRLKYAPAKRERAKGERTEDSKIDRLFLHLDALKSLTDGCAQYADLINTEVDERRRAQGARKPRSSEPRHVSLKVFERATAGLLGLIKRAYEIRDDAENLTKDGEEAAKLFLEAASAFQAATDMVEAQTDEDIPPNASVILKGELAFCLMFTKSDSARETAESLFREILASEPDNANVLARLGQLRSDAGDFDESSILLNRGLAITEKDTTGALSHINWVLCRDLAYVSWRLVDRNPQGHDSLALLSRAIEVSQRAMDASTDDGQWRGAALNLLYYLWDVIRYAEDKDKPSFRSQGDALLKSVRSRINPSDLNVRYLDSLVRAERVFGEFGRAKAHAQSVISELDKKHKPSQLESSHERLRLMSAEEQDMYIYALETVAAPK